MEITGATGRRITGLRELARMTLEELAAKAGVNATTLGRLEKGQTQKIGIDVLTALAREFNVSTDFLLGLTDIPDRKNYGISELGLSAQAVRNLYTRKVNVEVVSRILEQSKFATLSAMIAQYLDDTFAAGAAAQNQIFTSLSEYLLDVGKNDPEQSAAAKAAARAVSFSKVPPYQVELTKMQNMFVSMLKEMKRDAGSDLEPVKTVAKEVVGKMMSELTKGQDAPLTAITPEQITDAIVHTVEVAALDPEKVAEFRGGLNALFKNLPRADDAQDNPAPFPSIRAGRS